MLCSVRASLPLIREALDAEGIPPGVSSLEGKTRKVKGNCPPPHCYTASPGGRTAVSHAGQRALAPLPSLSEQRCSLLVPRRARRSGRPRPLRRGKGYPGVGAWFVAMRSSEAPSSPTTSAVRSTPDEVSCCRSFVGWSSSPAHMTTGGAAGARRRPGVMAAETPSLLIHNRRYRRSGKGNTLSYGHRTEYMAVGKVGAFVGRYPSAPTESLPPWRMRSQVGKGSFLCRTASLIPVRYQLSWHRGPRRVGYRKHQKT